MSLRCWGSQLAPLKAGSAIIEGSFGRFNASAALQAETAVLTRATSIQLSTPLSQFGTLNLEFNSTQRVQIGVTFDNSQRIEDLHLLYPSAFESLVHL